MAYQTTGHEYAINIKAASLDERMFLPPLEYLFFPGKFCGTSERAKKVARSAASQFHGLFY